MNHMWYKDDLANRENKYDDFISKHYQNCLNLVSDYSNYLKDKVIIDIGSNIGLFAKAIAETLPYSQLHLFEPSVEYLNKSKILLKQFKNITYNNFAVGNIQEEKILYKSKDSNLGWNTLYEKDPNQDENFIEKMDCESIHQIKLDDYYKDIEKIDFIKIDVEGYERNVLEGSWNLIKKFKPHILIEVAWGNKHPDWELNKKTYENLFSLGYKRVNLDLIEGTKDILFEPINKNNVTLVTGLWNAGRGDLDGMWNRSFDFYIERFVELLKTDNNLIVFGDEDLRKIVFEHRSEENTQFIYKDLSDIRKYDYYPLIQKVRNDPNWKFQNDWIGNCPLGAMEMAVPIYLSKMVFLNEAIEKSKFDSDFFYHVDGGTRMNVENFSKQIVEEISNHTKFFFICFPYIGKEIHGFNFEKAKELTSDSIDSLDMVPRGTFFGGHKDNIKSIFPLYYDLMIDTLNQGYMGLDESLFTILVYNHPELIDYHRLSEEDGGEPEAFLKKFQNTKEKNKLFEKIRKKQSNVNYKTLPISVGILSWRSEKTLRNTLESYKKNGLLDLVNDATIFFQEVSDDDKKIANEYKIPFIGIDQNIGIGEALIKLTELARTDNILLLEHDWELIENKETTFKRLSDGLELINSGCDVVRYRHRRNPGYPLYTYQAYKGKELNNYQPIIELESPHLMDSIHWIENPEIEFADKISKEKDYFTSTSRWSNFTNNPCIYKKEFYLNTIYPFKGKGQHLENDISYWWSRQNFKVAQGEGLFMHNDIEKHGAIENISYLPDKRQNSIAFIFAHRDTDKWSTPLSVVNEFKRLGWKTEIYSLFDSNDNYTDDNIHELLKTNPDIIMHLDWGQHTSPILHELRKTGAYCVMESGDDPQRFGNNSVKASWFDLILSPDIRCVEEYKKMGHNAEWWTHFSDTNIYFPLDEQPTCVAVCSRGMGNDAYIIDNLAQKYPNQIKNENGFWGEDHNKFLNSGEMILQQSRYGEITRRIFEGMSCNKLVLADKLDPSTSIEDLFVDGEDIVFYEGETDCLNKVVYYCNNQEEAKRIAKNGYNKVLNDHTQKQRVEFIINKWKSVVK